MEALAGVSKQILASDESRKTSSAEGPTVATTSTVATNLFSEPSVAGTAPWKISWAPSYQRAGQGHHTRTHAIRMRARKQKGSVKGNDSFLRKVACVAGNTEDRGFIALPEGTRRSGPIGDYEGLPETENAVRKRFWDYLAEECQLDASLSTVEELLNKGTLDLDECFELARAVHYVIVTTSRRIDQATRVLENTINADQERPIVWQLRGELEGAKSQRSRLLRRSSEIEAQAVRHLRDEEPSSTKEKETKTAKDPKGQKKQVAKAPKRRLGWLPTFGQSRVSRLAERYIRSALKSTFKGISWSGKQVIHFWKGDNFEETPGGVGPWLKIAHSSGRGLLTTFFPAATIGSDLKKLVNLLDAKDSSGCLNRKVMRLFASMIGHQVGLSERLSEAGLFVMAAAQGTRFVLIGAHDLRRRIEGSKPKSGRK